MLKMPTCSYMFIYSLVPQTNQCTKVRGTSFPHSRKLMLRAQAQRLHGLVSARHLGRGQSLIQVVFAVFLTPRVSDSLSRMHIT